MLDLVGGSGAASPRPPVLDSLGIPRGVKGTLRDSGAAVNSLWQSSGRGWQPVHGALMILTLRPLTPLAYPANRRPASSSSRTSLRLFTPRLPAFEPGPKATRPVPAQLRPPPETAEDPQIPVEQGRDCSPDEGSDDEQPYLGQGHMADDDRRAETAGWIDRCAGQRDADEVHHGQRQADGQAGEAWRTDPAGSHQHHEDEDEVRTASVVNAPPAPIPTMDVLWPQRSAPSPTPERLYVGALEKVAHRVRAPMMPPTNWATQ